jgi:hypothetical protein
MSPLDVADNKVDEGGWLSPRRAGRLQPGLAGL